MNWYKKALKEYNNIPEGGYYLGTPWPKAKITETSSPVKRVMQIKSRWTSVESSAIKEVAYDERLKVLEIRFKRGGRAEYWGVPKRIFNGLLRATSKGEYFNRVIKPNFKNK